MIKRILQPLTIYDMNTTLDIKNHSVLVHPVKFTLKVLRNLLKLSAISSFCLSRNHIGITVGFRTQRESAKITEKISKTLGVDFEKVDHKIIIFYFP